MLKKFMISAAVAGSLAAGAAHADEVRSDDPSSLARVLQDMGYRAELTTDNSGDPMIKSSASGADVAILFYGCKSNRTARPSSSLPDSRSRTTARSPHSTSGMPTTASAAPTSPTAAAPGSSTIWISTWAA